MQLRTGEVRVQPLERVEDVDDRGVVRDAANQADEAHERDVDARHDRVLRVAAQNLPA